VSNASYADNPATQEYVDFYVENLETIAEAAKFIPLSEDLYAETQSALEGLSS
jgi:phosphate transport system substrate-binding protein